jgi:hypothetical protein
MEFGYYLMIKEAKSIGLKYLCKCADNKDPIKYRGSGVYWRRALKKHNISEIETTIIGHYPTAAELREAGIYYSEKYNVVRDKEWANLCEEIGDGGSTVLNKYRAYCASDLSQMKCFNRGEDLPDGWVLGMPKYTKSKESIEKTRRFHLGRKRSEQTRENMKNSKRRERRKVCCDVCNKLITLQNLVRHQKSERCSDNSR